MKTWDGVAPGVVSDNAETFGPQNLQSAILGGLCVAPNRGQHM